MQQLLPEDRAAQALCDLFGAPLICAASLTVWARRKAEDPESVYRAIGTRVGEAKVRCPRVEEPGPGFRIAGKTQWLHTTSSESWTFYRVGERRGDVPAGLKGEVVVHDHFCPYAALDVVDHAF